jgi:hypothetical protein
MRKKGNNPGPTDLGSKRFEEADQISQSTRWNHQIPEPLKIRAISGEVLKAGLR